MPITSALIGAGGSLLGGMMASDAASRSADATIRAAEISADAAKFRPFGVKTGYGTGFFDTEAQTAGYELDPRLAAARDFYYREAEKERERLASLDPQAYAAQRLAEQQQLIAPQREAENIALRQQQLQRGRIGFGVSPQALGAGMLGGAVNPEQYALDLSRARADAEMAIAMRDLADQKRIQDLEQAGLLFQTGLGIEELGMKPLEMGAQYGGRAAQAGAEAGKLLSTGLQTAAQTRLAGGLGTAQAAQNIGKQLSQGYSKSVTPPMVTYDYTPATSIWGSLEPLRINPGFYGDI